MSRSSAGRVDVTIWRRSMASGGCATIAVLRGWIGSIFASRVLTRVWTRRNVVSMTTTTLTHDITTLLAEDGWQRRWATSANAMTDEYGNIAHIHEYGDGVRIEFEYALPGVVETLYLRNTTGARRIVLVILALASPEE